jgi:hypothetical protein
MSAWWRDRARSLGIGRLLYKFWHGPLGRRDQRQRYGRDFEERARLGEEEMRQAGTSLPPQPPVAPRPRLSCPVHVLTGANYWHQTAFCLHSLQHAFGEALQRVVVHSDGTLGTEHKESLRAVVPGAVFEEEEEVAARLDRWLPESRFPVLRRQRLELVLMRKLLDALAGQDGYHLFVDSDVLFWREPRELVEAATAEQSLYLDEGSGESYCLPRAKLERELGMTLPPGVNSGLVGLQAGSLDWELLERAVAVMEGRGNRRILEQSLWGVALATQNPRALDPTSYKLCGYPEHVAALRAGPAENFPTMVHYAWHARYPYLESEWKIYFNACTSDLKGEAVG